MAPRKAQVDGDGKAVATRMMTRSVERIGRTRSETRRSGAGSSSSKLMNFESPERKKRKTTPKKDTPNKKIKIEEEVAEMEDEPKKEDDVAAGEDDSEKKTIVIEHCKQCTSFKKRAIQVKGGLEKAVPGIIVTVNAVQPRRGCFEIREEGGETFISLLEMKRPFTPMKELDMEQVIADIVEKIK
ncbi:hypothetical protein AALP_AA6G268700 [Arabis alpina]|uniref:Selenoprotein H n=1 Tax=Arabis alpina TaxID=50452 RepID=A0A087GRY1_ARAAL|nr:hypothetical protein AALP_AA6G268700 [Arabis alpina]